MCGRSRAMRARPRPWVERGCELAIAEMSDAAALARAFAGAEGVFVLIPPIFDPSPGFAEAERSDLRRA